MEERGDDVMAMRYLWFVYYEGYGTTGWDRVLWVWQWCLVLGVLGFIDGFYFVWVGGYDGTVGLGVVHGVGLN